MLADIISFSRIILAYPMYLSLINGIDYLVVVILSWMIASDVCDGAVARYYGFSSFGAWLDPIADACGIIAWVLALLKLELLSHYLVFFWFFRYLFFVIWAIYLRYFYFYKLEAGIINKLSIVLLAIFLVNTWLKIEMSSAFVFILVLCQIFSMFESVFAGFLAINKKT